MDTEENIVNAFYEFANIIQDIVVKFSNTDDPTIKTLVDRIIDNFELLIDTVYNNSGQLPADFLKLCMDDVNTLKSYNTDIQNIQPTHRHKRMERDDEEPDTVKRQKK
jgi:hypothetical protein